MSVYLRKCRKCGKVATTMEDLKAFVVNKPSRSRYGRQNLCIDCSLEYNRNRRLEHPEIYKARQKRTLDKHPETRRTHSIKWRKANKEKGLAEHYVYRHKLRGKECDFCGSTENVVAHHPDYSLRAIIVTCCSICHRYIHDVPVKGELA